MKILLMLSIFIAVRADFLQEVKAGIFKETIGKVAFINRDVQVWVTIDLDSMEMELDMINSLAEKIENACDKSVKYSRLYTYSCKDTVKVLRTMTIKLYEEFNDVLPNRVKRQVSEFFDLGVKVLFGTIEYFDRKDMRKKLEAIVKDSERQKIFNADYIKLLEEFASNLNDTNDVINHQTEIINKLDKKMNDLSAEVNGLEFHLHNGLVLNSLYTIFNSLYFSTLGKIEDVQRSITDLQNNVWNTKIISYKKILAILQEIKIADDDLKFPFSLKDTDYEILRKLTKFVVLTHNKDLIMVFSVPLVEDEQGVVSKLYSIPTLVNEVAEFIDITSNMIVHNEKFSKYIDFTRESFTENCEFIKETFYCKNMNVMRTTKTNCMYKALIGDLENVEIACGTKLINIVNTVLQKTEQKNRYLSFTGKPHAGSLVAIDSQILLDFKGTQILTVDIKASLSVGDLEINFYGNDSVFPTRFSALESRTENLSLMNEEIKESIPNISENKVIVKLEETINLKSIEKIKNKINNDKIEDVVDQSWWNWSLSLGLIFTFVSFAIFSCTSVRSNSKKIRVKDKGVEMFEFLEKGQRTPLGKSKAELREGAHSLKEGEM